MRTHVTAVRAIAAVAAKADAPGTTAAAAATPQGPAPDATVSLTGWGRLVWFDPGDDPQLHRCMAPATLFPVRDGGYTIRDANLIPGR